MSTFRDTSRIARDCKTWASSRNRNANQRCGFSLMELILVMTILVAFAALSLPTVQRSLDRQGIIKGADLLRASMGKARVRAIKTGKIHAVFYLPDTSYYTVAPFDTAANQAQLANQRLPQIESRSATVDFADDLLPRGVRFAAGTTTVDGRASDVLSVSGSNSALRPLLFYPDGTSQDAKVLLQNMHGDIMQVVLRGLTGTSTSTRVVDP